MQDSIKNYWKLGKDYTGDTLWMQKPRLMSNGYWEVALVFHYPRGMRPGKGYSRLCTVVADEVMASSAAFEGLLPDDKRLPFAELIRAIVTASRYSWMMKRGNTGLAHVPGEELALNDERNFVPGFIHSSEREARRIDNLVIPALVKLVNKVLAK